MTRRGQVHLAADSPRTLQVDHAPSCGSSTWWSSWFWWFFCWWWCEAHGFLSGGDSSKSWRCGSGRWRRWRRKQVRETTKADALERKDSSALRVSLTRDPAEVTNVRVCCCARVPCWMILHANAAGDLPFQSQVVSQVSGGTIAFLGSFRFSQRPVGMRCAHIRGGARHHVLDRNPGRRRRGDPHPASRIVPAPRLVWTRP